ncbi:hypothetical protein IFM89_034502 [Coptis chinensis]|uniref:DAGKc domain-containing protein n=1 Tax=Coptis chinensis TaxID=261450 RepID=A0A835HRC0_9MAGN|nr:hypothetical protein IFM89_034502 [Coptis chinensis]
MRVLGLGMNTEACDNLIRSCDSGFHFQGSFCYCCTLGGGGGWGSGGGDGFFNEILNGLLSSRHKVPYPPAPAEVMHSVVTAGNISFCDPNEMEPETSNHNEDQDPLLHCSAHIRSSFSTISNGVESCNTDQSVKFSFPNERFRLGIIPAGSTDAIVVCTTGTRDPITSALHIVLGRRVSLDIAQVVRWKATTSSMDAPYVRYAASFAGSLSWILCCSPAKGFRVDVARITMKVDKKLRKKLGKGRCVATREMHQESINLIASGTRFSSYHNLYDKVVNDSFSKRKASGSIVFWGPRRNELLASKAPNLTLRNPTCGDLAKMPAELAHTSFALALLARRVAELAKYGFYGDVIKESESIRWMGPKRYDYAGTKVFLKHRSYEAEIAFLEVQKETDYPVSNNDLQDSGRARSLWSAKKSDRVICRVNCSICTESANKCKLPTNGSSATRYTNLHDSRWLRSKGNYLSVGAAIISCRNGRAPDGLVADAHLSDGFLHLILIKDCPRSFYLWHLTQLAKKGGNPLNLKFVEHHKTPAFAFTSSGDEGVWNLDGEILQAHQLSAQVCQGLVCLFASGPEV